MLQLRYPLLKLLGSPLRFIRALLQHIKLILPPPFGTGGGPPRRNSRDIALRAGCGSLGNRDPGSVGVVLRGLAGNDQLLAITFGLFIGLGNAERDLVAGRAPFIFSGKPGSFSSKPRSFSGIDKRVQRRHPVCRR